ncbi:MULTISPECIES: GTP cyclohydrolase II RibA [unclassified Modicisalibacter]|uniref:GTP cyclohydrolase II RibA n=1 Tax=unclassified Modicisalibacter TaxID=2679913 RepID=UPI001CCFB674|nr:MULTISPECIES: GTP cyclohydrolase II RibA [unclassified Modicisalibacter]MBZ9560270.1 GTP cyclohydrolase II RibA [Modicisalibacter sp. R2A 31.J]MBZ9576179.1 GTP cyclohydrolase II RibA [Modicisalibacter sp. MOD 31.J]
MHQVERALFDIRRGLPVLLRDADEAVLVHPLESVDEAAFERLAESAEMPTPALVLSRHRLARLGHRIDADSARLALPPALWHDTRRLHALAFGLEPGATDAEPLAANRAEQAALALMRRALLIPAALTRRLDGEARTAIEARIAEGALLGVAAEDAERCLESADGMLRRVSEARIPLAEASESRFILFREPDGLREHVAIVIGDRETWQRDVPLRLHSACLTGDLFASLRCDCGEQLRNAVAEIAALGGGVLLYLAQEGRGIGLANKLRAYALQDEGLDTLDADQVLGFGEDERRYGVAVDMLAALGVQRVQLLTNNPVKIAALAEGGIEVAGRQALYGRLTEQNYRYLHAKAHRAGHLLDDVLDGHSGSERA